jgi:DnaJ-class molecular chaperone
MSEKSLDEYQKRKLEQKERFDFLHGRKMTVCVACNSSGRYDNFGSPKCSSCNGTGKELDRM